VSIVQGRLAQIWHAAFYHDYAGEKGFLAAESLIAMACKDFTDGEPQESGIPRPPGGQHALFTDGSALRKTDAKPRPKTIAALAKELNVDQRMLLGQMPMP
jgi:hypothetical protein